VGPSAAATVSLAFLFHFDHAPGAPPRILGGVLHNGAWLLMRQEKKAYGSRN
jgi:hypothetical protein